MSMKRSSTVSLAVDMIDLVARQADQVLGDEPSQFCKECKHWVFVKTHFVLCSAIWLLVLAFVFFVVGLIADLNLFGRPEVYFVWMPMLSLLTWTLVVLRFAFAMWLSPKASDATSSVVFLATFLVLHLYTWQQVGTAVGKGLLTSDYYRSYEALARRMQVPPPAKVQCFQDIYSWLERWVDEWLPETMGPNTELHPGWMPTVPPQIWTQRVEAQTCDYMSFNGASCTQAGALTDHCEVISDWTLSWAGGHLTLPHSKGDFLNFRGQPRESPQFPGKLARFRFGRGFAVALAGELAGQPVMANRSRAREIISQMRNASFIDSYMRVMYMDTRFMHFYLGQWITLRMVFEQDPAGYIEPSLKVYQGRVPLCRMKDEAKRAALMARLAEPSGLPGLCEDLEGCSRRLAELGVSDGDYTCENVAVPKFWPAAMAFFIGSAQRFYFPVSEGSGWYLAVLVALTSFLFIEELAQLAFKRKAYFKEISNYFELATIFAVYMIFNISLQQQGATPQDGSSWTLYCTHIETLQRMCGFACFLWWIRLLNFVSNLHPRMRVLIHTLQNAWVDLSFFCAMFAIVLLAFAMSFHIWFSSNQAAFMDLWSTFVALFRGLIGDISAAKLTGDEFTTVFYMAYVILSMLIMVNVFIAIISASFEAQQTELRAKEAQRAQKAEELVQWLQTDPGEDGDRPAEMDVLKVVLWGGRGLRPTDLNGLADPRAVFGLRARDDGPLQGELTCSTDATVPAATSVSVRVDDRYVAFEVPVAQTPVVLRTLDPDWNQTASFALPRGAASAGALELFATLLDADVVKDDDAMGKASAPLSRLLGQPVGQKWASSAASVATGGSGDNRVKRHALKVEYRRGTYRGFGGVVEVSVMLHGADASPSTSTRLAVTSSDSGC